MATADVTLLSEVVAVSAIKAILNRGVRFPLRAHRRAHVLQPLSVLPENLDFGKKYVSVRFGANEGINPNVPPDYTGTCPCVCVCVHTYAVWQPVPRAVSSQLTPPHTHTTTITTTVKLSCTPAQATLLSFGRAGVLGASGLAPHLD